jgi:hypothetical protein
MTNPIHEQLNTAALINLIAEENDPMERQRLRIQLGFTDIVDKLLLRADSQERDMGIRFDQHEDRLDAIEPVLEKHQETIITWRATIQILVGMFFLFQSALGIVVYRAWEITSTMYEEVKELTVVIPKIKTIQEEARLQTKVLTETKKDVEATKSDISEQLDNTRFNDDRLDSLNKEIEQ